MRLKFALLAGVLLRGMPHLVPAQDPAPPPGNVPPEGSREPDESGKQEVPSSEP